MTRALRATRWTLYGAYVLAAVVALLLAMPSGVELLGMPPERVNFLPLTLTGLPWSGPLFVLHLDSVTTLAVALVANVLNVALGLMLARGDD
jgi:hypothetical protein